MSYDRQSSISHYDPFYEDWGKWADTAPLADVKRELRNAKRRAAKPSTRFSSRKNHEVDERNAWTVKRLTGALEKRS